MKTPEEITRWCDMMLKLHPNIEDTNFFNSIKDYMKEQRPQGECEKCPFKHTEKCDVCINHLRNMQSKPDRSQDEKNCVGCQGDKDFGCEDCLNKPKNDLISREALLKKVDEEREYLLARGQTGAEHILVHHCLPLIDNAPTVEPERPKGEWVWRSTAQWCSECGVLKPRNYPYSNYCPSCGAKMIKGAEE